ncbi:CRAL/TRIO domain containing protein [Perkinsela sp. CCAP 1560/4]|nr:CRAL/TRIO domain containing protein [Perkinsela sp. CCAP 1560/4]|eukprot:KNH01774.1 CRAL/TRIO domain containing protein [Perkinsela sp. CCAP 1560/4]
MFFPEEHERTTEALDSYLHAHNINVPYCHNGDADQRRTTLRKFLLAKHFNITDAVGMIQDVNSNRTEHALDEFALFPAPSGLLRGYNDALLERLSPARPSRRSDNIDAMFAAMRTGFSGTFHKWDRQHRPIWIERTGLLDFQCVMSALTCVLPPGEDNAAAVMSMKVYINEMWTQLFGHQHSITGDTSICQTIVIMDCQGLSMKQLNRQNLDTLRRFIQYDQRFFPERVFRIYLVNVGIVVQAALKLVTPLLSKRVQEKIVMLKPHEMDQLQIEIDPDNLPEFLGGKCSCAEGCVPLPSNEAFERIDRGLAEKISIPAGQRVAKTFQLASNVLFRWGLHMNEAHSIVFSAIFDGSQIVVSERKLESADGPYAYSHTAVSDGTLTLIFDNSSSWVRGKSVTLRIDQ